MSLVEITRELIVAQCRLRLEEIAAARKEAYEKAVAREFRPGWIRRGATSRKEAEARVEKLPWSRQDWTYFYTGDQNTCERLLAACDLTIAETLLLSTEDAHTIKSWMEARSEKKEDPE